MCRAPISKPREVRHCATAAIQPSLYMARLPIISKYCWVRVSGASGEAKVASILPPSTRCCFTPLTSTGAGEAGSVEDGGRHVDDVFVLVANAADVVDALGQKTTMGSRVPPRCEAMRLPHWKGALPAQAQPTG